MLAEWLSVPEGTLSGRIRAVGEVAAADCVVIQELGSKPDLASNTGIIDYTFAHDEVLALPMFISGSLVEAVRARAANVQKTIKIVHAFEGNSAAGIRENLGTYGEWLQFIKHPLVQGAELRRPLLVTSSYNAGNSVRQARERFGIHPVVPGDLPRTKFDHRSNQVWTKSWLAWAFTSHVRIALLRKKGH